MDDPSAAGTQHARWRFWTISLLVWTILVLLSFGQAIVSTTARPDDFSWVRGLLLTALGWAPFALATPPVFWLCHRMPLERPHLLRNLMAHLLANVLLALLYPPYLVLVRAVLDGRPIAEAFTAESIAATAAGTLILSLFIYWSIVAVGHAVEYARRFRDRERRASRLEVRASLLEAQLTESRLQTLETQLQPHFLFNTLNGIATLVREGEKSTATRMIAGLSDLLRIVLDRSGGQMVPLKREVEFLEKYLEIERMRFPDRLTVEIAVAPETLDARVPSLILQPIVENAIRHGVSKRTGPSHVEIAAWRENGNLRLRVSDDGPGLPGDGTSIWSGIGIGNTRERLEQLYGSEQTFALEPGQDGGVVASLTVPFRTEPGAPE